MSKRVYGIDLGTTYSCIAYVDEHGKPVVVSNSENQQTTPSVVYFESPDNVVVGTNAKENARVYPDLVVSAIKRSMGSPDFKRDFHGKPYTPAEISSYILLRLVKDAATLTGDEIKDVVITCPAYFGVVEKMATKQAGIIAGLNPLYIIPEPTAAAVAYGIEDTQTQTILVYDLGGGTFDITLISVSPGEITVVATGGDHMLGGKEWDERLVNFLVTSFEKQTGTVAQELLDDDETYQELLYEAENVKIRLSQSKSLVQKVRYRAGEAKVDVTRETFDELTRDLLERTVSMTREMLDTGERLGVHHVDKLLLVGGSTYMPQVIERVKREFPFEVIQFDPNMAVAKGAALFGYQCELINKIKERIGDPSKASAAKVQEAEKQIAAEAGLTLAGLKNLTGKKISNVSSKSFGLVVEDLKLNRKRVENLVIKNSKVPNEVTKPFATVCDGQIKVNMEVMQNLQENDMAELSECVPETPIGTAVLTFERALPKDSPIEVTFTLAADGCLSLYGRDLTTGRDVSAEFKTETVLSQEELVEATSRALATRVSAG